MNADSTIAAVSNLITNTVTLYSLPDGKVIRSVGKKGSLPGQFTGPEALCFTPTGSLMVADCANTRIVEVSLTGDVIRIVGVGVITESVTGLDMNADVIIATQSHCDSPQIVMFDTRSGSHVRSFGEKGSKIGQLNLCRRAHITPDGAHIIAAEDMHYRVSMFTLTGLFVKCFTAKGIGNGVRDAIVTPNDEVIVGNSDSCRLAVFSLHTGRLLRQFGPDESDELSHHSASCLAVANGRVFELAWSGPELHVFE